ncbi:ATP-binding protein [Streptomyces sp. NPDC017940]|uniref:ATP-binding protein n=1 Tax=Streptomyces sp. NPDC017940 TaxID=3365017 RepID=UPI0037BE043E
MGTVTGRLDEYLPLDPDDVLEDEVFTIQLEPRAPGAPVPRHETEWVGRCRQIGAARMNLWGLPPALVKDAMVVISELTTNALRYGNMLGFRLIITRDKVGVVVTDGVPGRPYVRRPSAEEEHGRGMLLVETFSSDWGVRPDGRATWCTFTIPARQS